MVKLGYALENYVRWGVEHRESRELSDERAAQIEAEEREWEEQKQRDGSRPRAAELPGSHSSRGRGGHQVLLTRCRRLLPNLQMS